MPIFKFTSPSGEEYYGEGADAASAFQSASHDTDPSTIAAMRQRQSVRHGAAPPDTTLDPETQAVTDATRAGDYGPLRERAFGAGQELFGYAAPMASLLGETLSPTAVAGGQFDAEPDPKKRKALQAQYDAATPKGKREIVAAYNAEQSKIQDELRHAQEAERATVAGKKERADWESQMADAIAKFPENRRNDIKSAGTLAEARAMYERAAEERRQAGMTLAERYPPAVLAGETAAVAGDIYAPFRMAGGRARALTKSADEAAEALKKYRPGTPKVSSASVQDASATRKALEAQTHLHDWSAGGLAERGGELALGATVPYVAGNIPNAIDMLMGTLSSDPAAKEKVQRAWESATDPMQFIRSLGVGLGATALGTFAGNAKYDTGRELARGRGILSEYEARDTAAANKVAAAAARKQELADAKAAAKASSTAGRESAAAERERLANANLAKTQYAATAPAPLTEIQQRAADAEAAKSAAANKQAAIRAMKAGGAKAPRALKTTSGSALE